MGIFEDLKMIDEYSNVNNKEENDMAMTTLEENVKQNDAGYGDIFDSLMALGEATIKDRRRMQRPTLLLIKSILLLRL